ncbi:chemotaxis protein CheX, partial [Vibrio campbellii]
GHTIRHKCDGSIIIMPFTSEWGNAFIEICFE